MKTNRAMDALLATRVEIALPPKFRMLVAAGFKQVQQCIFFRELFRPHSLDALALHHDFTGYECAVNAVHLTDYLERDAAREPVALAATSLVCARWLADKLREFSTEPFRVMVSVSGRHAKLRFHKLRADEVWLHPTSRATRTRLCSSSTPTAEV